MVKNQPGGLLSDGFLTGIHDLHHSFERTPKPKQIFQPPASFLQFQPWFRLSSGKFGFEDPRRPVFLTDAQ